MAVETYDGGDPMQGIDAYEIHPDSNEVTIWFKGKGSSDGYVRPLSTEFQKLLESGNGATRYYNRNLR
jgi:hypothetical protein